MAYLGVTPTQEFSSVAKQSVTGDGSVSYTLNKGVSDANDLAVFVNDVRQEPGVAYTASGNTITFTANLESTDDCYILHIGRTFSSAESPGIEDKATQKVLTITTDGHLVPTANVTYDLGTSDLRFRDIYLSGSSINLGDHSITANSTHISMGNVVTTGVMTGNGALVTSLNASELASGTIPLARLPDDITIVNDLTIGGDFIVNGNTTTIAANELKVEDSLIQLASNNEISDTVDIGFVGHYYDGSTQVHTGFFRDASDEQYYLFKGYEDATFDTDTPPATIDRTANTFVLADLNVGAFTTTGSVGIGTDNPNAALDVNGGTSAGNYFYGGTNNRRQLIIKSFDTTSLDAGHDFDASSINGVLTFSTYNTERMRINSSGNLLVGTSSQSSNGSHKVVIESASTVGTISSHLALIGDSAVIGQGPQILFSESGDGLAWAGGTIGFVRTGTNSVGDLVFGTRQSTGDINTTTTEAMRITAAGNVGIGGSVGTVKLYVVGATNDSTQLAIRAQNLATSDLFFVRNDGSMVAGIGSKMTLEASGSLLVGTTSNPDNRFDLVTNPNAGRGASIGGVSMGRQGSGYPHIGYNAGPTGTNGFVNKYLADTSSWIHFSNGSIIFNRDTGTTAAGAITGTESMRIDTAGEVGIGISNPQRTLHINGGATRTDIQLTLDGYGETAADGVQFGILTTGSYIWNFENTDLYFATNNARRFTIAPDGKLIIGDSGVATGDAMLSIEGDAAGADYIRGVTNTGFNNVNLGNLSDNSAYFTLYDNNQVQTFLHRSDSEQTTLAGSDPDLIINGTNASGTYGVKIRYNSSSTHGLDLRYFPNSAVSYIDNTYQSVSGTVYGDIYFRQNVAGTLTTHMAIKADGGYVTKPKQPAFEASVNQNGTYGQQSVSQNSLISFAENFDIGNNFNGTRFTAPIAGRYLFAYHLEVTATSSGRFGASLYKNGSKIKQAIFQYDSGVGGYMTICDTEILNLSENDYVEVKMENVPSGAGIWSSTGSNYSNADNGGFRGYFLG